MNFHKVGKEFIEGLFVDSVGQTVLMQPHAVFIIAVYSFVIFWLKVVAITIDEERFLHLHRWVWLLSCWLSESLI